MGIWVPRDAAPALEVSASSVWYIAQMWGVRPTMEGEEPGGPDRAYSHTSEVYPTMFASSHRKSVVDMHSLAVQLQE